jgi:hypothetical protein
VFEVGLETVLVLGFVSKGVDFIVGERLEERLDGRFGEPFIEFCPAIVV